ncbi:hypothetical protein AA21952_0621 [Acetobacter oeni LMG 21952]|nr:hypothetical protein AA21952_0621 [Acetobacter oeni LMG 21952]
MHCQRTGNKQGAGSGSKRRADCPNIRGLLITIFHRKGGNRKKPPQNRITCPGQKPAGRAWKKQPGKDKQCSRSLYAQRHPACNSTSLPPVSHDNTQD